MGCTKKIFTAENPEEELSFTKSCIKSNGDTITIKKADKYDVQEVKKFKQFLTNIVTANRNDILAAWSAVINNAADAQASFNANTPVAATIIQYLHRWWSTTTETNKKSVAKRLIGLNISSDDAQIAIQLNKVEEFIKTSSKDFKAILTELFDEIEIYLQQSQAVMKTWADLRSWLLSHNMQALQNFDYIGYGKALNKEWQNNKDQLQLAGRLLALDENYPNRNTLYRKLVLYLHPDKIANPAQKGASGADELFKLIDDAYKLLKTQ